MAAVMAALVVVAFSTQLAMGRSSFGAPARVHIHAVLFMGWTAIFVTQSWLGTRGPIALHRRLGWIAAGWMVAMLMAGMWVMIAKARAAEVPFFFRPQVMLIINPITLLTFCGLTIAAVTMRRRTDWHARLHICGMSAIMGPAFGRLLPMPFLTPVAMEIAVLGGLLFPIAGIIIDRRRRGAAHPVWGIGIAVIVGTLLLADAIAYSPAGDAIYGAVTAGSPGAEVSGMDYPPPPPGAPLPAAR
jgi:hypothetical protein